MTLKLEPVPKVIKPLVVHWCPEAFIVSFKLETNPEILLDKARQALQKYEHNAVIANLLVERKHKVVIVRRDTADIVIHCHDPAKEIEESIVDRILALFRGHRKSAAD